MAHLPQFIPEIIPFCYEHLTRACLRCNMSPHWSIAVMFLVPLLLPNLAAPLKISYALTLFNPLFSRRIKIKFRADRITITKWWIYRRGYSRENITFESIPHPKSLSTTHLAQDPSKPPQTNFYANSFIVVMRQRSRCSKVASIYDWKASRIGHRADQLIIALHKCLNGPCGPATPVAGYGVLNTAQVR